MSNVKDKDDTDDDTDDDDKGGGDDDDKGGATDHDKLVADVAAQVLELLGANDDAGGSDGGDGGGGDDGKGSGGAPRSAVDVERATERAVRDAMAKLRREEANEGRLRKLERRVEETVKEAAPASVRRLTKFMWGAGDKAGGRK